MNFSLSEKVQSITQQSPFLAARGNEANIVKCDSPGPSRSSNFSLKQPGRAQAFPSTDNPDVIAAASRQVTVQLFPETRSSPHRAASDINGNRLKHDHPFSYCWALSVRLRNGDRRAVCVVGGTVLSPAYDAVACHHPTERRCVHQLGSSCTQSSAPN